MSALKSLSLAIEVATIRRDQALAQLNQTLQAQAYADDQMQQLQHYAQETELRWMANAHISTSPELLHHHYQFMGRLNQAITLQTGTLSQVAQRVDTARQIVLQAEYRLASLKQVLNVKQAELTKLQQRREQKQMDEFATQQTQRQRQLRSENSV